MWYVYRIYYNDKIVYVGRTNNLENRIRQHVLSGKVINILKVSKIDYIELETESDMNLYELYYILKLKPELNTKDFAKDELSVTLPEEYPFKQFHSYLWDDWVLKIKQKNLKEKEKQDYINIAKDLLKTNLTSTENSILQEQLYIKKYN